MITHLSLFSGIGGLDLAAEWAGIETIGQCEWEEYPRKVLEKHWPEIPRWKDIKTLTGDSFYERTGKWTVDIISGGFPCQPFSVAGKQRGKEDDRYLWPEMVRIIKELRPTWVIGENVTGIIRLALTDILSELESCGYRTRVFHIPASGVGARHHRYRVAIVGYSKHNGLSSAAIHGGFKETERRNQKREKTTGEFARASKFRNSKDVQHTYSAGRKEQYVTEEPDKERITDWRCDAEQGTERSMWRASESRMGRMADGFSNRMDGDLEFIINHYWDEEPNIPRITVGIQNRVGRFKCLGNAVVPQQFYPIFKAISEIEGVRE